MLMQNVIYHKNSEANPNLPENKSFALSNFTTSDGRSVKSKQTHRTALMEELQRALENRGLTVSNLTDKGRSLFTTRDFSPGALSLSPPSLSLALLLQNINTGGFELQGK